MKPGLGFIFLSFYPAECINGILSADEIDGDNARLIEIV